jgi:hypothetical protein
MVNIVDLLQNNKARKANILIVVIKFIHHNSSISDIVQHFLKKI